MKKRILIIGFGESPWHKIYLDNVFKNDINECEIIFVNNYSEGMYEFCNAHNIIFHYPSEIPKFILKIPKIRKLYEILLRRKTIKELVRKYKYFDFVHVQYVTLEKIYYARIISKYKQKLIYTFWGSDLFRISHKKIKMMSYFIKDNDYVTFMTQDMKHFYNSIVKHNIVSKSLVLDFGSEIINYIDKTEYDIEKYKKLFGFDNNHIFISIGYNGLRAQQHCKVIKILNDLPKHIKQKIVIILQMTYGLAEEYHSEICRALDECSFKYIEFTKFMDPGKLAEIRIATDIFIHAQTTDSQAASVNEYLYAKKIVLNPTWIKYSTLKDAGVFYEEYSNFNELPLLVMKYCGGIYDDQLQLKLDHNHKVINSMYSWSELAPKWLELYK